MRAPLFVAALALSACAPYPPAQPGPPGPPPSGDDMCRASEYRYLIGRHRSEIPREPAGANWRATCASCPVTMDYSPSRLNILYDERTGVIQQVNCG